MYGVPRGSFTYLSKGSDVIAISVRDLLYLIRFNKCAFFVAFVTLLIIVVRVEEIVIVGETVFI